MRRLSIRVRRAMTVGLAGVALSLLALGCTPTSATYTGHYRLPTGFASAGRTYWLHTVAKPGPPRPLLIFLPGWRWTASYAQSETSATPYADTHNFSLVYAEGIGEAWNAGGCCGNDNANDVQYLADVVAAVEKLTPVDTHRIYLMGFSNGGMMAFRAACERPDLFAAAATVAGPLLVPCPHAVRVIHLHGTADLAVPLRGGYSYYTGTYFPDSLTEPARLPRGSTEALAVVPGLGHYWPTPAASNINGVDLLWNWLYAHPR